MALSVVGAVSGWASSTRCRGKLPTPARENARLAMSWGVEFKGLTEMILGLDGISQKSSQAMAELTRETGEDTFLRYLENLEGSSPSTDSDPLPVGMRSGDLFSRAELSIINQYAWEIRNLSDHAAYIEYGTKNMVARGPLQDAVNILEISMDERNAGFMRTVIQ